MLSPGSSGFVERHGPSGVLRERRAAVGSCHECAGARLVIGELLGYPPELANWGVIWAFRISHP